MTEKLQLGVVFGGRSGEHEVALMSARSILSALDRSKYEVVPFGITKEGKWLAGEGILEAFEQARTDDLNPVTLLAEPGLGNLYSWREDQVLEIFESLDVVFPVLHGTFGEDGTMQGLLELADIPYVGAGVLASSLAMDKGLFKTVMRANGIPVVDWTVVLSDELESSMDAVLDRAEALASYPLFTKPANLGSSVGVSKCRNRSDLLEGMMDAARYDRRVLVERGVEAREIEVSVLGNESPEASIAGEVVPGDEFYSYKAKYIDDTSDLLIPAPIEKQVAEQAREMAVEAFKAIDGAGMGRADFLLDKQNGHLYMNEINTIPGFTKISMYPKLWEASGLTYPELLDRLVELAFDRQAQKDKLLRSFEVEA
ncbi:MAG: D-alanine--D-alanine ligase [Anaerolineales bacterium]|nr:D-alanine--D-alanine ligase [Anaerolineales bacterium]